MGNFFKKLARALAIILVVIAIVLLIIACILYANMGAMLLPSVMSTWEPMGILLVAFACATVAVMLDPAAATSILSKVFDSAGSVITTALDSALEVVEDASAAISKSFFSSPIGITVTVVAGVLIYKTVKGDKHDSTEQRGPYLDNLARV